MQPKCMGLELGLDKGSGWTREWDKLKADPRDKGADKRVEGVCLFLSLANLDAKVFVVSKSNDVIKKRW